MFQFCKIADPVSSNFHSGSGQALLVNLNVVVLMQWLNVLMVENQSIELNCFSVLSFHNLHLCFYILAYTWVPRRT